MISTKSALDIYSYFQYDKLNNVKCPNGKKTAFNLQHVLNPVFKKKTGSFLLSGLSEFSGSNFMPEDIVSFVAFGSAVRYPRLITKFKKESFRGALRPVQVHEEIIAVRDFDFALILTEEARQRVEDETIDVEEFKYFKESGYGGYWATQHGKSQIFLTSLREMKERYDDTNNWVAKCIISEGVLLFGKNVGGMRHRRIIQWKESLKRGLEGEIIDSEVVRCEKCQNETIDHVRFCPVCGGRLLNIPEETDKSLFPDFLTVQ